MAAITSLTAPKLYDKPDKKQLMHFGLYWQCSQSANVAAGGVLNFLFYVHQDFDSYIEIYTTTLAANAQVQIVEDVDLTGATTFTGSINKKRSILSAPPSLITYLCTWNVGTSSIIQTINLGVINKPEVIDTIMADGGTVFMVELKNTSNSAALMTLFLDFYEIRRSHP